MVCALLNECRGQATTGWYLRVLSMHSHGVSLLYCFFSGYFLCSCSGMSSCWACWTQRTAIPSTANQVSQADQNSVQDGATFSAPSRLQLAWMTRTCMADTQFVAKAQFFAQKKTVMHHLAVSVSAIAGSAGFRIPAYFAFAFASLYALYFIDSHNLLYHTVLCCMFRP